MKVEWSLIGQFVTSIKPEMNLVLQLYFNAIERDCNYTVVVLHFGMKNFAVKLKHVWLKVANKTGSMCWEIFYQLASEFWSSKVNLKLHLIVFIIRVYEFCFSNEHLVAVVFVKAQEWHSCLGKYLISVLADHLGNWLTYVIEMVEDFDLIINADACVFAKTLDTVSDFSSETKSFKLIVLDNVEHNRALHAASNSPWGALLVLILELLRNS